MLLTHVYSANFFKYTDSSRTDGGTFCPLMQYTKYSKKLEYVVTFSRVGHVHYPKKFEHAVQALHNG